VILVDSSIWIDHLNVPDTELSDLLGRARALIHPFVIGEIALGSLRDRERLIGELTAIKQALVAEHDDVMTLIERHALGGTGIGYVDAHLLASVLLSPGLTLWTRDKRLAAVASRMSVGYARMQ
jgi:predicted nucleic acid-binding protein